MKKIIYLEQCKTVKKKLRKNISAKHHVNKGSGENREKTQESNKKQRMPHQEQELKKKR